MSKSLSLSYTLLISVLTLVFNIRYEYDIATNFEQNFAEDLKLCFGCFESQILECRRFFLKISYDPGKEFQNFVNQLLPKTISKRQHQWLTLNTDPNVKLIAKDFSHQWQTKDVQIFSSLKAMKDEFLSSENLEGFQFCPKDGTSRFVEKFSEKWSEMAVWLYMVLNVQPLLMAKLEALQFPVPKTYAVCGLTLFQGYAGQPLSSFYAADFRLKLQIALQLLEGAAKFSEGFDGFRLYITDLSEDNVVYDPESNRLAFIDLDTVYVSDSQDQALRDKGIHRQEYLECAGCFAYSPSDLCSHSLSDINVFQVCQLLREDLDRKREKGFLYPIPPEIHKGFPALEQLVDECVECEVGKCANRFAVAKKLVKQIQRIFKEFYLV